MEIGFLLLGQVQRHVFEEYFGIKKWQANVLSVSVRRVKSVLDVDFSIRIEILSTIPNRGSGFVLFR